MVPVIPSDTSYALCQPPSFDIGPGTDIKLGTILNETKAGPKRPDTRAPLNRGQIPEIDDALIRRAPKPQEVILHTESLRSNSSSIWAHVDFLPGIGGRLGGERSRQQEVLIYAQDVRTEYFSPSPAFMAKALAVDPVKDQLGEFHRPVVYMVTGIKVARGASIVTGTKNITGAEVGPEVDLSQFGIPINVGAGLVHKFRNCSMVGIRKEDPFVLAFETRRIKVKKDSHKQELFTNFALLDDEVTTNETEDLLDSLEVTTVTLHDGENEEEVGDDSS
jgi:hypothetical protein